MNELCFSRQPTSVLNLTTRAEVYSEPAQGYIMRYHKHRASSSISCHHVGAAILVINAYGGTWRVVLANFGLPILPLRGRGRTFDRRTTAAGSGQLSQLSQSTYPTRTCRSDTQASTFAGQTPSRPRSTATVAPTSNSSALASCQRPPSPRTRRIYSCRCAFKPNGAVPSTCYDDVHVPGSIIVATYLYGTTVELYSCSYYSISMKFS